MISQSARRYLERAGLIPTRRRLGRPILDPSINVVRRLPVLILPEHQLVTLQAGSPDLPGEAPPWPVQEVQSVR